MGRAVEGLTTLPPDVAFAWGVAVLAAIMLLYETLGGFRAVAWTDVIQGGILAVGFFVLLALIFVEYGSLEVTTRKLAEIAPAKVLPPKAKITALVWSGRNLPKLVQGKPRFSSGIYNCAAMITPTSMPTTPQMTAMMENCRTTVSLYITA